jgi:site-specific DNA-methyltransferase (adenine-specific)
MKLTITYLKTGDLLPYASNSRTHSAEQVAQIAASIKEFGFATPICVAEGTILAGHGRVMAAKKLGMEEVRTVDLSHLTPAQRRAYVIADNKLALNAGWDEEILAAEIERLKEDEFDVSVLGFSDEELAEMANETNQGLTDPDETPEPPEQPVSVLGDVWVMGKHRVMCGDSTSAESITKLLAGKKADLWITDPPYNVAYEGKTKDALTIQNDSMEDGKFREFLRGAYAAADANMREGGVFYIWHADTEGFNFRGAAHDIGWKARQCLVWVKNVMAMGRQDYQWRHEPCLYGWKEGAGHSWESDRKQTTVLEFKKPSRNGEHPTMKPIELFAYQIGNSSRAGGIVLDSFGGSGTTAIACEQLGRQAHLMELDPGYVDVIVKRWQDFAGKQAVNEATGKTFDETKAKMKGTNEKPN